MEALTTDVFTKKDSCMSLKYDANIFLNGVSIKGCDVTLNFLPDSNGKAMDTVKRILITPASEYRRISGK